VAEARGRGGALLSRSEHLPRPGRRERVAVRPVDDESTDGDAFVQCTKVGRQTVKSGRGFPFGLIMLPRGLASEYPVTNCVSALRYQPDGQTNLSLILQAQSSRANKKQQGRAWLAGGPDPHPQASAQGRGRLLFGPWPSLRRPPQIKTSAREAAFYQQRLSPFQQLERHCPRVETQQRRREVSAKSFDIDQDWRTYEPVSYNWPIGVRDRPA